MKDRSRETLQTLKAEIQYFLSHIDELDNKLMDVEEEKNEESLIIRAYYLSGIYSCFEDIFFKIANVFGNRIDDPVSWHRDLLLRMRISVEGIRQSVISKESFILLDELRGFRHVFRSSYMFVLDVRRLSLLISKWNEGKEKIKSDIQIFCDNMLIDA